MDEERRMTMNSEVMHVISEANVRLLALLADVLHERKPQEIPMEQWPEIKKELRAQTVSALPGEFIRELGLSPAEELGYLREVIRNRQIFHPLMREQTRVLALLESAGIPVVVLKGAAAAIYYPHPENRCMGDIDLLVLPEDFARAYELLASSGYRAQSTPEDRRRHIIFFSADGIEIELHKHFSAGDDEAVNARVDAILYAAIPRREERTLCGYPVTMLPTMENGLVLLDHINHHVSSGLGLRQLVDWAYYAEAVLDDAFWNSGFAELADSIGEKRLATVVTATCRKYFGLPEDTHWCAYEPVCDELMEYVLAHGNFGKKLEVNRANTVSILKRSKNPIHVFRLAQRNGLANWKAAREHTLLRPFAWVYQFGRWARHGIEGGVTLRTLSASAAAAREESEFLERLGATRL